MRVLPSIEKGTDLVRVHQLYNSTNLSISALVKRPLNQASDTWIAFLCNPSPGDGDVPAVMDRSPMHKKRWPTAHPIVIWNGSVVSMEKSLRLSADPTPPGKEEDADVGLDKGWNTYKRYDRRDRSNSNRSRTSNESDTGSGKSDSSLSERSRGKRKSGSNSESDGSKSDDNFRVKPKIKGKSKDGTKETPSPPSATSTNDKANLIVPVSAIKKETSVQDNSAKRILQFTEQMSKVMAIKTPGVSSKKESEKARNTRENAELVASVLLQRKNFKEALTQRKFQYVEAPGDNFCLFHSVAMDQREDWIFSTR